MKIQNYFVYSKISSNIVSNCNYPSNSNNSFSIENEQKSEQTNTVSINRTNEFSQQYDGAKKIRFLIKIHARRNVRLHAVYISFPFKRLQFFLFFFNLFSSRSNDYPVSKECRFDFKDYLLIEPWPISRDWSTIKTGLASKIKVQLHGNPLVPSYEFLTIVIHLCRKCSLILFLSRPRPKSYYTWCFRNLRVEQRRDRNWWKEDFLGIRDRGGASIIRSM